MLNIECMDACVVLRSARLGSAGDVSASRPRNNQEANLVIDPSPWPLYGPVKLNEHAMTQPLPGQSQGVRSMYVQSTGEVMCPDGSMRCIRERGSNLPRVAQSMPSVWAWAWAWVWPGPVVATCGVVLSRSMDRVACASHWRGLLI